MTATSNDSAQAFHLSAQDVRSVAKHSITRMNELLACDGATQIPSFVTKLPTGTETGQFLAVDLGGTFCRVCLVDLQGDSTYRIVQAKHAIPQEHMVNSSHKPLFDFVATSIKKFLDSNAAEVTNAGQRGPNGNVDESPLKLAFTFSFTYKTISLTQGEVLQWDKGWDIPDAIGQDPCSMLQQAIDRLGLRVNVVALTSDSVSTLVAEAYTCKGSTSPLAGVIFGTGTNAAYAEHMRNIRKLPGAGQLASRTSDDFMVINSEWGGWYDQHPHTLPCTPHDETLDKLSSNPREQLFEKRVSAMYLPELTRLAVLHASEKKLLTCTFRGTSTLHKPYSLSGSFLSALAEDCTDSLDNAIACIEKTLDAEGVTRDDARLVRSLSTAIVRRAARLSGAAIAAIIIQSGRLCVGKPKTIELEGKSRDQKQGFLASLAAKLKLLLCWRADTLDDAPSPTSSRTESLVPENEMVIIGVDGSLFEFYPTFEADMRGALRDVPDIGPAGESRVQFRLTRDGSSLGAALVAHAGL